MRAGGMACAGHVCAPRPSLIVPDLRPTEPLQGFRRYGHRQRLFEAGTRLQPPAPPESGLPEGYKLANRPRVAHDEIVRGGLYTTTIR